MLLQQLHLHSKNVWNPREMEPLACQSHRLLWVLVRVLTAICQSGAFIQKAKPSGREMGVQMARAGLRREGAHWHCPSVWTDAEVLTVVLGPRGAAREYRPREACTSSCTVMAVYAPGWTSQRNQHAPCTHPWSPSGCSWDCRAQCRVYKKSHNNKVTVASPDKTTPLCKHGSGEFLFVLGSIQNYNWPLSY